MQKSTQSAGHSRREKLLLQASRLLNSTVEYEDLIKLALQLICQAVNSEAAFIFRIDEHIRHRRVRMWLTGRDEVLLLRKEQGTGVSGWVINESQPAVVNDVKSDPRYNGEISRQINLPVRNLIAIPLASRGKTIGALEAINRREGDFDDIDRDTLIGLADQIAIAIDNSQLIRSARRRAFEQQRLLEVVTKLSGALEIEEALKMILDCVHELVGFDAGGIFLVDKEKNEFGRIFYRGYDQSREDELHIKLDHGLIGWVAKNNECVWVPDVKVDDRYVEVRPSTRSELVAPMSLDNQVIGVFNLESDHAEAYDGHSAELVMAFGAQAAVAVERTRMHDRMIAARALQKQLEIAREIQHEFLPDHAPKLAGYDLAGMNVPSGEVGGDYYGYIRIDKTHLGLSIADVSGKGIPAALLMASFRASLLAEIRNNFTVRDICKKVNRLMHESVEPGVYVTAVYGALDSESHKFHYSNAGHNPPLLVRTNGEILLLEDGGPPFGIVSDSDFTEGIVDLLPGDTLILYTDGVTEATNATGAMYGEERLMVLLGKNRTLAAAELTQVIYSDVKEFSGNDILTDDYTVLIARRL